MFISKKKYNELVKDISLLDLRVTILEKLLNGFNDFLLEVLDYDQNVIDINKLVLDKLEEILKEKGLE